MARPYTLSRPEIWTTSVIFASPHSGREYPWAFLRRVMLDELAIRSSEDAFVDQLFSAAPANGAPLLAARMPRAFIDVNRAVDELDPALIEGVTRNSHNPRVASGLGVVPRVVSNGRQIYSGKITRDEADSRIRDVWHPWHGALTHLIEESFRLFGQAILIDCHSMPHEAIENISYPKGGRPEIVLGDRFGAAAAPHVVDRVEAAFRRAGLRVARNAPFAGAYVTQHYGRPARGQHVLQIEIDRSLYMDERRIRPSPDFADFRKVMSDVVAEISRIGEAPLRVAAE